MSNRQNINSQPLGIPKSLNHQSNHEVILCILHDKQNTKSKPLGILKGTNHQNTK
jgi:hypothetical protein